MWQGRADLFAARVWVVNGVRTAVGWFVPTAARPSTAVRLAVRGRGTTRAEAVVRVVATLLVESFPLCVLLLNQINAALCFCSAGGYMSKVAGCRHGRRGVGVIRLVHTS